MDAKFNAANRHDYDPKRTWDLFTPLRNKSKKDFSFWDALEGYSMDERMLLLACLHTYVNNENVMVATNRNYGFLYNGNSQLNCWNLDSEFPKLQATKDGLLEESGNSLRDDDEFNISLTESGIRFFFADTEPIQIKRRKKSFSGLLFPSSIIKRELYYDTKIKPEVDSIFELLSDGKTKQIFTKMGEMGLKKSIAILLSGAPGTGKSESAYQLAKASDRAILMVDISGIRDKWVGESEKNVKQIFSDYKAAAAASESYPILLLNEADALLGQRRAVSTSVDQMNNSMQNIFLQCMEDFEGILIATTNLVGNLDLAFDRRFLFKINFDTPSNEVRKQIWQSHIPSKELAPILDKLANFPLSGGEIANIVKRYHLEILLGKAQGLDTLISLASGETAVRKTNSIGFSK